MLAHNSERGEVPLSVGGVDLVIAAEMGRLAALSARLGSPTFDDFYRRLVGVEIEACRAGIELLCVGGDFGKALVLMTLKDLPACSNAFRDALLHSAGKSTQPGKARAAARPRASRGGRGRNLPTPD